MKTAEGAKSRTKASRRKTVRGKTPGAKTAASRSTPVKVQRTKTRRGAATPAEDLDTAAFASLLMRWYRRHARELPWRGVNDPYATWLSEIMLQQTRVAAVMERYVAFLDRFPTLSALAEAPEQDVLALWSGLGYYRRARMLHRAAQFVQRELGGVLPQTAAELRTLPGIGDYTAAAIASIAFGEPIAVVDGNVERVLLRVTGHPEEKSSASRAQIAALAQSLMPRPRRGMNAPGDHNQAMMELGAMVCLPRGPLCLQCPVMEFCSTRGEHVTLPRSRARSRRVAHLLALRKQDGRDQVLLEQRSSEATLMPEMFELPPLPLDAVEGRGVLLRLRHSITDTIYDVEVFAEDPAHSLLPSLPAAETDLHWASLAQLALIPLTGLARKALVRMKLLAAR